MKKSVLAALLVLSPAAWSADVFVGAHAGALLGYGAEVGVDFDKLTLRGQFSRFDYDDSEIEDNVEYESEIMLDNRGVLLDYHLFGGSFFLSAGIYDNSNSVDVLGSPVADNVLVGDQEFDSPKTLAAFALGLVLFIVTLVLNFVAIKIVQKYREQYD